MPVPVNVIPAPVPDKVIPVVPDKVRFDPERSPVAVMFADEEILPVAEIVPEVERLPDESMVR